MQVDVRDWGLIPGLGRSPGWGHGNPVQYSCLETPMDWTVHRVPKSRTQLKWLSTHARSCNLLQPWEEGELKSSDQSHPFSVCTCLCCPTFFSTSSVFEDCIQSSVFPGFSLLLLHINGRTKLIPSTDTCMSLGCRCGGESPLNCHEKDYKQIKDK